VNCGLQKSKLSGGRTRCARGGLAALRRRLSRASGQALVELALVLVPLMLLITGGVDFGLVWSDVIGMRQGVSSTARQAAVGEFGGDNSCTLTGGSFSGNTQYLACLVHDSDGVGNDSRTRVKILVGDASQATPSYLSNHPITICEQYLTRDVTGIIPFIGGHIATAKVTAMVEPGVVEGTISSTAETSIDNNPSSWNFCTLPSAP
jgi:hypothetical protein